MTTPGPPLLPGIINAEEATNAINRLFRAMKERTDMNETRPLARRKLTAPILTEGRRVIEEEAAAVAALTLGEEFSSAVWMLLGCRGTVVTTGVGKSGLVAQRIAATFTMAGTPAYFLHPTDALHGDVGIVREEDIILMVSRSGESEELTALLDCVDGLGVLVILITAFPDSTLAVRADAVLLHGKGEACPHGVVPTSSVTAAGVLGDALAMALQHHRGQVPEDFAARHRKGNLGRRLTMKVEEVMVTGGEVGWLAPHGTVLEVLVLLAKKRGTVVVLDGCDLLTGNLLGVVTAGDVTRYVAERSSAYSGIAPLIMEGWEQDAVSTLMTQHPYSALPGEFVHEAITLMERRGVMALPVVDRVLREAGERHQVLGMIHLHDALRARVQ